MADPVLFALETGLAERGLFIRSREPWLDGYCYLVRDHPSSNAGRCVMYIITDADMGTGDARLGDAIATIISEKFKQDPTSPLAYY